MTPALALVRVSRKEYNPLALAPKFLAQTFARGALRLCGGMLHGLELEFEESLALHALRQLKEVSRVEHVMEILSYVVSFGSFAVFIWVSKCAVASPSFRPEASRLTRLVYACVTEPEAYSSARSKQTKPGGGAERPETFGRNALRLAFCTVGIQVSYLLWGLMQERIMTRPYATGELFKSSKFLVFANRFLALAVAWLGVVIIRRFKLESTEHDTPLYKFAHSSVSNILSSVSQYEALKYVSFPTQVVAKSCKMVPVMLMGYVVSGERYTAFEYAVAIAITSGAAIFKLNEDSDAPVKNTQLIGIFFIVAYMMCDSFTSNWQARTRTHARPTAPAATIARPSPSSLSLAGAHARAANSPSSHHRACPPPSLSLFPA